MNNAVALSFFNVTKYFQHGELNHSAQPPADNAVEQQQVEEPARPSTNGTMVTSVDSDLEHSADASEELETSPIPPGGYLLFLICSLCCY